MKIVMIEDCNHDQNSQADRDDDEDGHVEMELLGCVRYNHVHL